MADGIEAYIEDFWRWYEKYRNKGGGGGGGRSYGYRVDISKFSSPLIQQLSGYFYSGQDLSDGAISNLRRIWKKAGRPGGKFSTWLDVYVKGAFGGG